MTQTVSQTIDKGSDLLGKRVEVYGFFVMNKQAAFFAESLDKRENHAACLRVEIDNLRKLILPRVLPRVGGTYQFSDEARIVALLHKDESGEFAFKLGGVEQFEINKLDEWRSVIP